jgi:hypothetical protein
MKFRFTIAVVGVLIVVLLFSGCTSTTPPVQTQTPVPTTPAVTVTPTPTPVPFPNALALNEYATFGSGNEQGTATVYKFEVNSDYNWTSPSWNSPAQQEAWLQYGKTTGRKCLPLCLCPRPEYRYQCRVCSICATVCRFQQRGGL